jgi:Molecular chaperone (small heat shock protein)
MLTDMLDDYYFKTCNCGNNNNVPAVNIKDNDKDYTIDVMAPGMMKSDFKVSLDNNILVVSSEKTSQENEDEKNYTRREYETMSFMRSFTLPKNVNMENITADYNNGILTIVLPKIEETKANTSREITVS